MGLSATGKQLYGLPHLGAQYVSGWKNRKRNYKRTSDVCMLCDSQRATNTHHVDNIGSGGQQSSIEIVVDAHFCAEYDCNPELLNTTWGKFILYTPLFAVCGMGNASGCHRLLEHHYTVEWIWNDLESREVWEKGWFLSHGFNPHDPQLFAYGHYVIKNGSEIVKVISHA